MQACQVDHITVTAPTLASGVQYVEEALGVPLQPGGEHPRMGTHNRLLRLGDAMFLEVIAVNPAAARPPRPRWFALDELAADAAPRLATWVARTRAIRATPPELLAVVGAVEPMSRGELNWLITFPADGSLPLGGAAPSLIEWASPEHPASRMVERGCSLLGFTVLHPEPARVVAVLRALGLEQQVAVEGSAPGTAPTLRARIATPAGPRTLGG